MKKYIWILILFTILKSSLVTSKSDEEEQVVKKDDENNTAEKEEQMKNLPKKMLARRREMHLHLLKGIANNAKYEWRFKLVETGVDKVFDLINENRVKLKGENDESQSEAKMIVIENCCLLMDFIVNFNKDIYTIFNRISKKRENVDWKVMIEISFEFLENNQELLDELTLKEYEFIKENYERLENELQLPDYPYENNIKRDIDIAERIYMAERAQLKEKEKKKLKKGPLLTKTEL